MNAIDRLMIAATVLGLAGLAHGCHDDDDGPPSVPTTGDMFALTSTNRLLSFANFAPGSILTAATLSGLASGDDPVGMDFRPATGTLYIATNNGGAGKLYIVQSVLNGAVTQHCTLIADAGDSYSGLNGTTFGVDFDPTLDRLRIVSDTGQNLRVNPVKVDDADTVCEVRTLPALTLDGAGNGATGAAFTNPFAAACGTRLFHLDSANSRVLASTGDPDAGQLTVVGGLGVTASAANGFEIGMETINAINTARAVLTVGGLQKLYTISLGTGVATEVGTVAVEGAEVIRALASPFLLPFVPGEPYGELTALNVNNQLVNFNRRAPAKQCTNAVTLSGLGTPNTPVGLDYRPATGTLFVATINTTPGPSRLYTVNPATGAATAMCDLGTALSGSNFGLDFDAATDELRIVSDSGQNLRVTPVETPQATCTTVPASALLATSGVTGVSYRSRLGAGDPASPATALFGVDTDTASDTLVRIGGDPVTTGACPAATGNPDCGVVNTIGSLGVDVGAVNGFEVDSGAGVGLLAATATAANSPPRLYTVNLSNGAGTAAQGSIAGGNIVGLAFTAAAAFATVYGATADGNLVRFTADAPGTVTTVGAISGLGAATVVGLDFRPATGELIAVTSDSKLYRIDRATGAATLLSTMSAGLSGTAFGVDFNPVADRLRIISDSEQNLRITPSDGTVATDTALTTDQTVFAAGYTNSYVGAAATALYALDSASDQLLRIGDDPATSGACGTGNPNCGVVTAFAPTFGVDVTSVGGFDIAGGNNAHAVAAMQVGSGPSTLYRINLTTGAATSIGTIATAGSSPITAMALRLN